MVGYCTLQGQLVGICGSIGSGKSSLISAILGQAGVRSFSANARYTVMKLQQLTRLKPGFHPNATHATQAIVFGWKPGLTVADRSTLFIIRAYG